MHIAIYGAGSLGTVIGACLTNHGYQVDLISRNKSHVDGLKAKGASVVGTMTLNIPVRALLPSEITEHYDIIFLLTKQQDNRSVIQGLTSCLNDSGIVCTMQNGLPEIALAQAIGISKTFGCSIAWGATLLGNGVSELTSDPNSLSFAIGSLDSAPNIARLEEIKAILSCMGTVSIESNFIGARWSKLLVNCSFSGMSAVLGCSFGTAAANKQSRLAIQNIIKECIDVAAGAGISIEPIQGRQIGRLMDYRNSVKRAIAFSLIPLLIKHHKALKASMLQDLERGRITEVDSINGIVRNYGRQFQVPTPYNDLVINLVHRIEAVEIQPSWGNLHFFTEKTSPGGND